MTTLARLQTSPALPRGLSAEDLDRRLYIAPAAPVSGPAATAALTSGQAFPLAGGALAFTSCLVLWRDGAVVHQSIASLAEVRRWAVAEGREVAHHVDGLVQRIAAPRAPLADLSLDRPRLMGIVNVTPDSFSDGGRFFEHEAAIAHGLALREAGAEILDVGGESTRPGSAEVDPAEEMRRVLPVIRALAEKGAVVSVDTRHAEVMGAAVEAGAAIINDITALTGDRHALRIAARCGAAVLLMHMRGEPASMQQDPSYRFAPLEVYDYLAERLAVCREAGIPVERLWVDPGIGFGKSLEHNLQILARLGLYHALGAPVCLGVSRKSFIAKLVPGTPAGQRMPGSLTAGLFGFDQGVQILRVHDVAETAQALAVWDGIRRA